MIEPERPITRLLIAHGPAERRAGDRLIWAFDERLAQIVRATTQPMIGQMRLAWWDEALGDASAARGRGDPLVDAIRAEHIAGMPGLARMLDGWEALLEDGEPGDDAMAAFAAGRGEGIFGALARVEDPPAWLAAAGRLWALWDLSGHLADARARARAVTLGRAEVEAIRAARWPRDWRALRIATALALHDVSREQAAAARLTPAVYARLVRIALAARWRTTIG